MAKQSSTKARGGGATIRDVADQAGVSMSTVSHVINATRFVSDEKRNRVLEAMQALSYRPNSLARSLRRQRSFTIGVVVPDSSNSFFADIVRGIEDVGFDLGYTVTICSTDGRLDKEDAYVNNLIDRQVDGVVIVVAGPSVSSLRLLLDHGIPTVVVDRDVPDVAVDSVVVDNYAGGYAVGEHFAALGYRRCGVVSGPALIPVQDRVRGYHDALQAHGIELRDALIVNSSMNLEGGHQAIKCLLELEPELDAVFSANDLIAVGVMRGAAELNYAIPSRLAVVGYDNIDLAAYTTPGLTTVAQPKYQMGQHAAHLFLHRLDDPETPPALIRLQPQLVVRESSVRR